MRILLCISTILESCAVPGDFSVAFMSTPLHDAEFFEPPIEAESDSRYVWKIAEGAQWPQEGISIVFKLFVGHLGFEKCSLVPTAFLVLYGPPEPDHNHNYRFYSPGIGNDEVLARGGGTLCDDVTSVDTRQHACFFCRFARGQEAVEITGSEFAVCRDPSIAGILAKNQDGSGRAAMSCDCAGDGVTKLSWSR